MKAMILAAGRGRRLRPLTDTLPKPLIKVGGKSLIEHHIIKCAAAGFDAIVINTAYLGDKIEKTIGDGSRYGIAIEYSHEGAAALETGGGIAYALPKLGNGPFLVISADIYSEIPFEPDKRLPESSMHLVMTNNPPHHPDGDFSGRQVKLFNQKANRFTYSGVAYLDAGLFRHEKRKFPLLDIIKQCIGNHAVSAELFNGVWFDIGTVRRLHAANKYILERL